MRYWMAVTLLLLGGTGPAAAACMGPGTVLAPSSGSILPEDPSIYLFVPSYREQPIVTAKTDAGKLPIEITELSRVSSLTTYRLDVDAATGTSMAVRVQDPRWEASVFESHYLIGATPPLAGAITIVDVAPETSRWTCSFQESHNRRSCLASSRLLST